MQCFKFKYFGILLTDDLGWLHHIETYVTRHANYQITVPLTQQACRSCTHTMIGKTQSTLNMDAKCGTPSTEGQTCEGLSKIWSKNVWQQ